MNTCDFCVRELVLGTVIGSVSRIALNPERERLPRCFFSGRGSATGSCVRRQTIGITQPFAIRALHLGGNIPSTCRTMNVQPSSI